MDARYAEALRCCGQQERHGLRLLRRYGWGVPTEERVLSSAASSVTLMLQDEFLPFDRGSSGLAMRAFRLHELPWPREQLRDLFGANVRLRVTLSYFVEPNPSSKGWQGRYRYASHGLRFDVKRPTETQEDFHEARQRGCARGGRGHATTGGRCRRSLVHRQQTPQLRLAACGLLDRNRGRTRRQRLHRDHSSRRLVETQSQHRAELPVRYTLLVSFRTEAIETDIYTPIATQIGIPVEITT